MQGDQGGTAGAVKELWNNGLNEEREDMPRKSLTEQSGTR